ncbi:hypothetical protein [Fretibacter rubidus]|uniref:hypothetical protein n=1 Tax=Fretibacter rubidus TaxID=570162 RepID=UPI00352A6396
MLVILNVLSTSIVGLYAGSLLTEAMILVPFWRRMDPADFFRLHGSMGPSLFRYFAPLTTSAVALSVAAAALNRAENFAWNITAGLCVTALIIFFAYFKKANQSFADRSLKDKELAGELSQWASWHWLRTALLIVAFALSIHGHQLIGRI